MVYEINHSEVVRRDEIGEFLDYVDGLKRDSEDTDYTQADRDSFKETLDEYNPEHVEQLRTMYDETSQSEEDFISEHYWDDYAADYADEVLLEGVSETIKNYFDYDSWASDMKMDYTGYEYDGITYYTRV